MGRYDDRFTRGYVYFIALNGAIKIGMASRLWLRFCGLKSQYGQNIEFINAIYVVDRGTTEHCLHEEFKNIRMHGEWFSDTPELRNRIRQLVKEFPATLPIQLERLVQL